MNLVDHITIISGGTPKTTRTDFWNGDIPWISIKDFNSSSKYIYSTEKSISDLGLKNSSTSLLKEKDIIISARGTVGCLAQIIKPMAFNQSCYGLRSVSKLILQDYLYYWLLGNIEKIKKNVHGAVFDTITKETFKLITINAPSIDIQQHIVDII